MKEPIETAPKDGTPILGIYEDGEVQIQWAGGHGYFGPGWEDCENKLIVDEPKQWRKIP